jgi:hypothetical protein
MGLLRILWDSWLWLVTVTVVGLVIVTALGAGASELGVEGGTRIETGIDFETIRVPDIPRFGGESDADLFDSGILSAEDVLGR